MKNIKLDQIVAECTAARKLCGVTIKQIADAAGVSPATISRFEHNQCDSIFVIAAYYQLCPVLGTGKLSALMQMADAKPVASTNDMPSSYPAPPASYYHINIDDIAGLAKVCGTTCCESVHDVVQTKLQAQGAAPGTYVWREVPLHRTVQLYQPNLAGMYEIPIDELYREVVLIV